MNDEQATFIQYYEQLPVAVYLCDRNDLLIAYNKAAATLFEIEPLKGNDDWYPTLTKYDQEGHLINTNYKPLTTGLRARKDIVRQEIRFQLSSGADCYILVSSVAVRDKDGNYDGSIHTLSDITTQRRYEKQQALLAAIVGSSEDAIIAKDLYGQITSWNRGAERIFGYKPHEVIGKHVGLIIPNDKLTEEKRIIRAIRSGKTVEHFETLRKTNAGVIIPTSLTISPIRDARDRIIGASTIARDISRQKKAEEQIKNYTLHLEDMVARRTAELNLSLQKEKELGLLKSRFVSMASHEFRTPLSAVKLSASLIGKYAETYHDLNIIKHTDKIKNAVNDLSAILGDFLSLEKLESGKISISASEFNLAEFCREIILEMQMLAKPGQKLIYTHSGRFEMVTLDQQLLKNCLNNLLSNAIKYSGEDTLIRLDTELNSKECSLSVTDQGIGIPEADKAHLFSAFFRASNTGTTQGTGLGLNIVARYVGLMNGAIKFESQPGFGTIFTLRFPRLSVS
ncbi:PAS domain-containing sensor histidine kinase [Mucilaginibacter gossypii]|uniref:sensor histidine kinase n=1 Tax=Mucilaginibacter gossypii TaxID=551996 RepID=UPI001678A94D|nr:MULTISPECIES: PAS domain-containing sensor histidine kinase [Mucilaginibacter]QTE38858.1 PAS domain-containing sensor histidine kinase [Mucilaginibacter gossypii]